MTALLASGVTNDGFEHVLFDTASTGHTLGLLSLQRAWTGFLKSTTQGASCLGPHSGLKTQGARFAAAHGWPTGNEWMKVGRRFV